MPLQHLKDLYQTIMRLVLVSGLVFLPWFQFSRSHVHFAGGTMIVHWHPSGSQDGKTSAKGHRQAGHNHSLAELLQLKGIQRNQGLPEHEPQICFVQYFAEDFFPCEKIIICKITVSIPTGRSPPSSILA